MEKQLIISVGREFGSGGHVIAEGLAKEFGLPLYDNNLLEHIAKEKNVDHEVLVSIFILGDRERKMERVQRIYQLSKEEALHKMEKMDLGRKHYHNYYCEGKWGDSRNYDICMNSSRLGIEGTIQVLTEYIKTRRS